MKKIKIAQIGTSQHSHGNLIWERLKRQPDLFEIAGYAFPEGERERFPSRAPAFDGYREMTVEEILSDPEIEAVAVETEELSLTKYALLAAKAGKHVHMEKPGGTDLAQFEELIETVKSKGLAFTVGYMYRFNPKIREALQKIRSGELGEIYSVEAHMSCRHQEDTRRWLANLPGGMTFFLGCHLIDLIYQIQGEPEEILPFNCSTGLDGVASEDYGMVLFRYRNGISFAKTCDCEYGGFLRRQLVICGSKGTLEIRPLEAVASERSYTEMRESRTADWNAAADVTRSETFDRYGPMMTNFAKIVRGELENPYSYDYELNLYRLLLRACGQKA